MTKMKKALKQAIKLQKIINKYERFILKVKGWVKCHRKELRNILKTLEPGDKIIYDMEFDKL